MLVSPENLADTPFFHPDRPQEIEHAFPWPRSCAADLLCLSYSSCTPQEKGFLLQFINGLSHDGGLATSWQDVTDCCKWEGITCRQANTVTDVLLVSKGLEGYISESLGNLTGLKHLNLSHNLLSGGLPLGLVSSHSITVLDVSFNLLNGALQELPTSISAQPLQVLKISSNLFTGEFPSTIWKAMENLILLNASNNSFSGGSIPPGIGDCSKLKVLRAGYNNLSGTIPDELFNTTLLEYLSFPNNNLHGALGEARIINLSYLETLDLGGNKFNGEIPDSIGQLKKLKEFHLNNNKMSDLYFNNFNGIVPESIYSCSNLTALRLAGNKLHGQLSPQIGNLKDLTFMSLSHNSFQNITNALHILQSCRKLTTLLIAFNFIGETIPEDENFDGLENLQVLGPSLQYRVPIALRKLLNLSKNKLTGEIPLEIGQLKALLALNFSYNRLTGQIPQSICNLTNLQVLDLSSNNLTAFNVSNNGLEGPIPSGGQFNAFQNSSFDGNPKLSEQTLVLMRMPHGKGEENKLKFTDILKATNNFDKENIIGCGGYGLVYKAELPDGSKLAIKKLNGEICLMEREFSAEVDALSMAPHENLVPLLGYSIQGNSRLLIYSYMENGSLDDWLHNRDDNASSFLDWPTRLKIAQGTSLGISYIHDVCNPQIVHRNIKSSYIPPEYGQAWVATLRGDMYSLGVVLLELLTGMRPLPVLSKSKELVPWVLDMRSQGKLVEVLDPTLRGTGYEDQMLKMLEAACKCIDHNQFMRPTIMEVVSCLASIDADSQMQNAKE
ncbi:hypothetical protein BRADI_3g04198v3 [Brachypodium distachyon]|uniref:Protein kinase domain-containing protein n=1 Tax=Brachypodium distachyon TaxID=15368 RepID=A0A2K2CV51_BRADI|nr:hypothetical protein BRADI_3g04198v3 [Brachypodium distachyon]